MLFSIVAIGIDYFIGTELKVNEVKGVSSQNVIIKTLIFGSMLGLFNALTSKMILINVGNLGGSVVYPIHNASVVAFTALIGVYFFKESFTKKQWIGILMAIIGVSFIASTL